MLPNIGYGELLVILVIALLLFGAKRIPEVAKALGRSVNAFKSGLREVSREEETKAEMEKLPQDRSDRASRFSEAGSEPPDRTP